MHLDGVADGERAAVAIPLRLAGRTMATGHGLGRVAVVALVVTFAGHARVSRSSVLGELMEMDVAQMHFAGWRRLGEIDRIGASDELG